MGSKVLIALLKATKAIFGSEMFMKAVYELVSNRQERKNTTFAEETDIRAIKHEIEKMKLENKKAKVTKRTSRKSKRRDGTKLDGE